MSTKCAICGDTFGRDWFAYDSHRQTCKRVYKPIAKEAKEFLIEKGEDRFKGFMISTDEVISPVEVMPTIVEETPSFSLSSDIVLKLVGSLDETIKQLDVLKESLCL